jgi:hypothetical protein
MNSTCKHTPASIAAAVAKYPNGMRAEDFARDMKICLGRAHEILGRGRRAGVISKVGARNLFRYCTPETLEGATAFYNACRALSAKNWNEVRNARRRNDPAAPKAKVKEWVPKQITRPALGAPPVKTRAARSIFDLGSKA